MKVFFKIILLAFLTHVESLIIPEELPSLLSLIYSNIPPVKKGTDSRLGFGFRLGPHADFQVLLELGPQTNTDPLGSATTENPAKRETLAMRNTQNLADYFKKLRNQKNSNQTAEKVSNTAGGKWIDWWRQNILSQKEIGKIEFNKVPGIDNMEDASSEKVVVLEKDPTNQENLVVSHLRQLYETRSKKSLTEPETTRS